MKVTCCQTVCAGVSCRCSGGGESLDSRAGAQRVLIRGRTQRDRRLPSVRRQTRQWREEAAASSASGDSSRKMPPRLVPCHCVSAAALCRTKSQCEMMLERVKVERKNVATLQVKGWASFAALFFDDIFPTLCLKHLTGLQSILTRLTSCSLLQFWQKRIHCCVTLIV